jgi:hypothetical protein
MPEEKRVVSQPASALTDPRKPIPRWTADKALMDLRYSAPIG